MAGDSPAPEEAIRECPFCGSEASVESNKGLAFYVTCDRSGCNACIGPERCVADAIAAWNRRAGGEREYTREEMREACQNNYNAGRAAGGEREQQLAAWISENSYELAMAVVGAYEMAPNGSGIDHSLAYAGDALMAMIKGECDPLEAVRKVIPAGRLWKEETHWLPRWQSGEAKVVVDTPSPRAALAGQTEP